MKMPSQVSMMLTHKVKVPAPLKPIKGVTPWGVGKGYRRCRREYAKQMRQWKRGPKTRTVQVYVPVATVEMISTTPAEPRDGFWDEEITIPTAKFAEFTFNIKPESRGLFLGQ